MRITPDAELATPEAVRHRMSQVEKSANLSGRAKTLRMNVLRLKLQEMTGIVLAAPKAANTAAKTDESAEKPLPLSYLLASKCDMLAGYGHVNYSN